MVATIWQPPGCVKGTERPPEHRVPGAGHTADGPVAGLAAGPSAGSAASGAEGPLLDDRVGSHNLAVAARHVDRRASPRVTEGGLGVAPFTRVSCHGGAAPQHGEHRIVVNVPPRAVRLAVVRPLGP